MKMLENIYRFIIFIYSLGLILSDDFPELTILGIEPNAGPEYGETRVVVRLDNKFTKPLRLKFPSPKVSKIFNTQIKFLVPFWKYEKYSRSNLC